MVICLGNILKQSHETVGELPTIELSFSRQTIRCLHRVASEQLDSPKVLLSGGPISQSMLRHRTA